MSGQYYSQVVGGRDRRTQKATKLAHKVQLTVNCEAKKLSETRLHDTFWLTSLWKDRKRWWYFGGSCEFSWAAGPEGFTETVNKQPSVFT